MSIIYPELAGASPDREEGPWRVIEGGRVRGSASCDLLDRILEVPLGADPEERVVRAHELAHARVSPLLEPDALAEESISVRSLECAEEFRVNQLIARLGFDTNLLTDGSERHAGAGLARRANWPELVAFAAAVAGTGGERPYLSGVKSIDPLAAKALRHIVRRLREMVRHYDARTLGDTTPTTGGRTEGYDNVTLPIARMLTRAQTAAIPQTPSEEKGFRKSLQPGGRRARSGQFAPLIIDRTVGTDAVVKYAHARRVKGSATGMTLRYPGRLLTDNARRAFARRTRARGGVVLIDQSGSMDVGPDELEELWRRCPDAWILGYSHTPGDTSGLPNAWVLAQPGSMTIHPRTGNVGNGVDGPALLWAARLAAAAPIVWVTDGQVTDANDHPDATLTMDCATLVRRERVRVVKNLNEVARALRLDPGRNPSRMREFGRLGRTLASENLP